MLGISNRYNMNCNSVNNNMGKSENNNMVINNKMPNIDIKINCNNNNESSSSKLNETPMNNIKEEEIIKKSDLQTKEDIMKIIRTQDFVNGFWEINECTEVIKEKYKKEYNLLIGKKNINEKVAITILIIYYINKDHPELSEELLMIIRKAKLFIINETKDNYENIIKDI